MPPTRPLVFFGTPQLAVPTLEALVAAGRVPLRVVTQPPRPAGRGQQLQQPPVARWALDHGLAVMQPERVRAPQFLAELAPLAPAVAVVVAFGQIFPAELLAIPPLGCLNLHASLLPFYRGASPIQAAIAAGETRTGVTVMQMEAGLDSGPILLQEETAIGDEETAGELAARLAVIGARAVLAALDRLDRGDLPPRVQDAALATYAPRLTRHSGRADWALPARRLADRLRAYTPWPGLTAELRGAPVKVVRALAVPAAGGVDAGAESAVAAGAHRGADGAGAAAAGAHRGAEMARAADTAGGAASVAGEAPAPGTFLGPGAHGLEVACGDGTRLAIVELQRPGKRAQRALDFANGERLRPGERFS